MGIDRRSFLLQGGLAAAGFLGLAQLPSLAGEAAGHGTADAGLKACRPADPLQALMAGNARFRQAWAAADAAHSPAERARVLSRMWEKNCYTPARVLSGGQAPWAAVLACADSRVAPEWLFDAALSDLFVIRAAGNTAFTDAVASLEYGVAHLGIPLVLVVGHSGCGAVKAAMAKDPLTPSLTELVAPIRASLTPGEDLVSAVKANARHTASQLPARSSLLQEAQASGKLTIRASYYDITSGGVTLL